MKVVGLGGSLRQNSRAYHVLKKALLEAKNLGCDIELLDLRELKLPFCDGSHEYVEFPDVQRLKKSIRSAHAVILSTPEYHGSLSGVLKNALDLLDIEDVDGKVFGLIAVMGGEMSFNAIETLRTVVRWLHGWTIPEQLTIKKADHAFDENLELKNEEVVLRLKKMVSSLVRNTKRLTSEGNF